MTDINGMLTIDGSDNPKKGSHSAGVARQHCGRMGKVENCQAGVYIGYSGKNGYGLLDAALYLPQKWLEDDYKERREKSDIPEDVTFRTKPQLACDMIANIQKSRPFPFKWVGGDCAFSSDDFREHLPSDAYFFGDVACNKLVFLSKPVWALPERNGNTGAKPTNLVPSISPVRVDSVAANDAYPWEKVALMEGSKGTVWADVKYLQVYKHKDGKDDDAAWLYIRKYENNDIKYAIVDAPDDIHISELHYAATLRWPIEQSFQECKSCLGMADYETRSFVGWNRHMLLVMVAYLFVLEVRSLFVKKTKTKKIPSF